MPKSYTLTIKNSPLTLTLTPPPSWGYCFGCKSEKQIRVISEHPIWIGSAQTFETRKFCRVCSLFNLSELEKRDYKIENKKSIVRELRNQLNSYG